MIMTDKWTKQLQRKMAGFEKPAPELSWSDIDNALKARKGSGKASIVPLWAKRAAAVAAAVAVIGGVTMMVNKETEVPTVTATVAKQVETLADNTVTATATEPVAAGCHNRGNTGRISESGTRQEETALDMQEMTDMEAQVETAPETQEETPEPTERQTPKAKAITRSAYNYYDTDRKRAGSSSHRASSNFAIDVHAQGLLGNDNTSNGNMYASSITMSSAPTYSAGEMQMTGKYYPLLNLQSAPTIDYDHDLPIKVGMSVRYNINDRWSLTSGVNYSYLHSTFTIDGDNGSRGDQKLHYIGVPLTANYNVWQNKQMKVYVVAGGAAEKLLKGNRSKSVTGADGETKVSEKRLQWSVQAAAGVEYNITPSAGLYLEPGVSHHFDNHSDVVNIYKDKSWNFSLNVGFRINLR